MKDKDLKKDLLLEIRREVQKNQISRELELKHVTEYVLLEAKKVKDKKEREDYEEVLNGKISDLKIEMKERVNIIKLIDEELKS